MNFAHKKTRVLIIALLAMIVILTSVVIILLICRTEKPTHNPDILPGNGLFSWHDEVFDDDERKILFDLMRDQNLTELYQDVPFNAPVSKIEEFAKSCEENGIRLYLLIGASDWALDKEGTELRTQIQRAALMGFAGVMVDIEPGSTKEWKKDRKSVMTTMTRAFLRGKSAAEENGLEMIVCLSYYYDDYGFEEELETIVEHGCDALAIMNYDRSDEIGQIKTEAAFCKKYNKRLINIYELQKVGKYELEEIHTYYEVGLSALQKSRDEVMKYFADQNITIALHEYRALKEIKRLEN